MYNRELTDDEIMATFVSEDDLINVIARLKAQIEQEVEMSLRQDKALYRQQVFMKLNLIFRRQIVLSEEEAMNFYTRNTRFLKERLNLFYDMLDKVNNEIKVAYIPDKLTACAFFRVSAETWGRLIKDYSVKEEVRNTFQSLEEFIISMTSTGVEIGQLKESAIRRMTLKGKFGGNELEYHDSFKDRRPEAITVAEQNQEVGYIATKYDFEKLENKN